MESKPRMVKYIPREMRLVRTVSLTQLGQSQPARFWLWRFFNYATVATGAHAEPGRRRREGATEMPVQVWSIMEGKLGPGP